jgi:hypothetical protein
MEKYIKKKLYECDVTESFMRAEFDTNKKTCWITQYYFDKEIGKTNLLGLLLMKFIKDSVELGIEYMTQTVYLEDWENIKKNKNWIVIRYLDDNRIEIKCKTEDIFDCLLDGFGY